MILEKFNELDVLVQTTLVCQDGLHVAELEDKYYSYLLYQYFDFYVEIKYFKRNFIFYSLRAFSAKSCYLDLYLNRIDISPCIAR